MGRRPKHPNVALAPAQSGNEVAHEDYDLERLAPDLVRRRWKGLMGRPAPVGLSIHLMARILVWKEQAMLFDPLDAEVIAILQDALADGRSAATLAAASLPKRLKPGTVLTREHAGTMHRVMVLKEGYAWDGQAFKSLSEVAKAITGTNWNGLVFFGLKKRASRAQSEKEPNPKRQVGKSQPSAMRSSASLISASSSTPVEAVQEASFKDTHLQGACLQDKPRREASLRSEGSAP